MVKKTIYILLAALAVVLLVRHFFPGDEQKIRQQFTRLADYASRPAGEKTLAGLQRASAVSRLFMDRAHIDVAEAGLAGEYDRQEIRTLALMFRNRFAMLSVECVDLTVSLDRDQAHVTATCRAVGMAGGERVRETREIRADLVRGREDDWLFSGFAFVPVLQR